MDARAIVSFFPARVVSLVSRCFRFDGWIGHYYFFSLLCYKNGHLFVIFPPCCYVFGSSGGNIVGFDGGFFFIGVLLHMSEKGFSNIRSETTLQLCRFRADDFGWLFYALSIFNLREPRDCLDVLLYAYFFFYFCCWFACIYACG